MFVSRLTQAYRPAPRISCEDFKDAQAIKEGASVTPAIVVESDDVTDDFEGTFEFDYDVPALLASSSLTCTNPNVADEASTCTGPSRDFDITATDLASGVVKAARTVNYKVTAWNQDYIDATYGAASAAYTKKTVTCTIEVSQHSQPHLAQLNIGLSYQFTHTPYIYI